MTEVRIVVLGLLVGSCSSSLADDQQQRPHVLLITSEDHGPHLGCYGDLNL